MWAAGAVSALGSRFTRTALPAIAVASLAASPRQAALLGALSYGPGAIVGLVAGGWIDRRSKRSILLATDLLRAALVASLPVAYGFGVLRLDHLYALAVLVGAATALFQLAELSYLPELLAGDELIAANGITHATESIAEITGPAAAGVVIRGFGAPVAMILDALSYLWSAAFLRGLPDRPPGERGPRASLAADLRIGLAALWRDPLIRRLAAAELGTMIASGAFLGLYMVFALRTLALDLATLGAVIGCGGVGALAGAVLAPRLARPIAWLPLLMLIWQASGLLIPAARGGVAVIVILLAGHQLVGDAARTAYGVIAISLRQRRLDPATMGRANAALHALGTGLALAASLVLGEVAERVGMRTALWIGLATGVLAVLPLVGLRREA